MPAGRDNIFDTMLDASEGYIEYPAGMRGEAQWKKHTFAQVGSASGYSVYPAYADFATPAVVNLESPYENAELEMVVSGWFGHSLQVATDMARLALFIDGANIGIVAGGPQIVVGIGVRRRFNSYMAVQTRYKTVEVRLKQAITGASGTTYWCDDGNIATERLELMYRFRQVLGETQQPTTTGGGAIVGSP